MKKLVLIFLTACGGDSFFSIPEGGLPEMKPDADSSDSDSSSTQTDGAFDAKTDAPTMDSGVDTGADSGVCPTGVQACDDAIALFCSRMKACCNGSCPQSWQNNGGSDCSTRISTGTCSGKMTCESACLSDLQGASCTTIKANVAPAFVSNSCMGLW